MSDKYISAEALILSLRDDYELNAASFARVKRHIEAAPDMVKRGKWLSWQGEPIAKDDCRHEFICSECNTSLYFDDAVSVEDFASDFCPNCGADMRGTEDC